MENVKCGKCVATLVICLGLFMVPLGAYGLNGDAKPDFIQSWGTGSQGWHIATDGTAQMGYWSGNAQIDFHDAVLSSVNGGGNDAILINKATDNIEWTEAFGGGNAVSGTAVNGGVAVTGYTKVSAGYLNTAGNISLIASDGTGLSVFDYNATSGDFDQTAQSVSGYDDVTAGYINNTNLNGFVATNASGGDAYQMLAGVPTKIGSVLDSGGVNPVTDIGHPELGNIDGDMNADLAYLDSAGTFHWAEFNGTNFIDKGVSVTSSQGAIFRDISLGNDADGDGYGEIIAANSNVTDDRIEFNGVTVVSTFGNAGGGGYHNVAYERDESLFQVPEPMTMSLLGLGALAVIRRKRSA